MTDRDDVPVLFDEDVERCADMTALIDACSEAVDADVRRALTSPPRHSVEFGDASLVFTSGGLGERFGFRAYDIMAGSHQDQVVAVWSTSTGRLVGVVIGSALGAYRTGALGGVAIDRLAPMAASTCAVIGSGRQARTQLLAAATVRPLTEIGCYSPTPEHRDEFAASMSKRLASTVRARSSAREAVEDADIVILATTAREPVIEPDWLMPTAHVTTVGPKFENAHEVAADLVSSSWRVASDSPHQIAAHGDRYFVSSATTLSRIEHLGASDVSGQSREGRTCYLSTGLAGTEVLVAGALINHHAGRDPHGGNVQR